MHRKHKYYKHLGWKNFKSTHSLHLVPDFRAKLFQILLFALIQFSLEHTETCKGSGKIRAIFDLRFYHLQLRLLSSAGESLLQVDRVVEHILNGALPF